jgi:small subunit ribosomal protein S20
MPTRKAAWKDLRKNLKRQRRNIAVKSELKTLSKKLEKLISSKVKAEAEKLYRIVASKLDKAASTNILHRNTASRKKSRLMKKLSNLT